MRDAECVQLLQWALPQLGMRWPGFCRVRVQVCKRIDRRLKDLGLPDASAYKSYLEVHPDEWPVLDALCHITISRFCRDRGVFDHLRDEVLPALALAATGRGETAIRCLSVGCASGEEPYTLSITWHLSLAPRFPNLRISIDAADIDQALLDRALAGCYPKSSLKDLPQNWKGTAFICSGEEFCIKPSYREPVRFLRQDIRHAMPDGPYHLILCRNLVFTYFDEPLQREVLAMLEERLILGGALVVGIHEHLPADARGFEEWTEYLGIYRKHSLSGPCQP